MGRSYGPQCHSSSDANLTGFAILLTFYEADNHKFLLAYWCLAMFTATLTPDPRRSLIIAARWMIALTFLLATFWKIASPDYMDGRFFSHALVVDQRFQTVANFAEPDRSIGELNLAAWTSLLAPDSTRTEIPIVLTTRLRSLSVLLTWWTFSIELAIGIVFLAASLGKHFAYRDVMFVGFIVTTYLMAPVYGFGWLLAIMGLAQVEDDSLCAPLGYFGAFVALQLYRAI